MDPQKVNKASKPAMIVVKSVVACVVILTIGVLGMTKLASLKKVMRKLMKFTQDRKRELIDGVRILNDDSWVLVAPDRQKASFYILSESEKKSTAEKQLQEYSERVWEWQEQA